MKTFPPIIKEEQGELFKVPETTDRKKSKKSKNQKAYDLRTTDNTTTLHIKGCES